MAIPNTAQIEAAQQRGKFEAIALGFKFKEEAEARAAIEKDEREGTFARNFTMADRRAALEATVRAAWYLKEQGFNVGLELYNGDSGVAYSDHGDKLSFDIILLTPRGPSADVMVAGVTPKGDQIDRRVLDEHGQPLEPQWAAAYVEPFEPVGEIEIPGPDPDPTPTPDPDPDPEPEPLPEDKLDQILSRLDTLGEGLVVLATQNAATATNVQNIGKAILMALDLIQNDEYEGTMKILNQTVRFTLKRKPRPQ